MLRRNHKRNKKQFRGKFIKNTKKEIGDFIKKPSIPKPVQEILNKITYC